MVSKTSFQPSLFPHTHPTKPPSQFTAPTNHGTPMLRDTLSLSTWLLCGAVCQSVLFLLPLRPVYTLGPAAFLLFLRLATTLLQLFGVINNPNLFGTIKHMVTAPYPTSDGSWSSKNPDGSARFTGDRKICVLLIGTRSNHPLGFFNPGMKKLGQYMNGMIKELEENADATGWLGGKSYLAANERSSANELLMVHYFRSMDDLHRYAHGPKHRAAWDWWNQTRSELGHVGIFHESYEASAGQWENIYENSQPTLFGATSHAVTLPDGHKAWQSSLIDVPRGKLRTSAGRRGVTDGTDNDAFVAAFNEKQ